MVFNRNKTDNNNGRRRSSREESESSSRGRTRRADNFTSSSYADPFANDFNRNATEAPISPRQSRSYGTSVTDSPSRSSYASREEQLAARRKAIESARRRNDEMSRKIDLMMVGSETSYREDAIPHNSTADSTVSNWSGGSPRESNNKNKKRRHRKTEQTEDQTSDKFVLSCTIRFSWLVSCIVIMIIGGVVAYFVQTKSEPLPEDCDQIRSGAPVLGQQLLTARSFDLILDVKIEEVYVKLPEIMDLLESEIQKTLMPELVGCSEEQNRKLRNQYINPNRFIVGNGNLQWLPASLKQIPECSFRMCFSATFNMDLFLKVAEVPEQVKYFEIVNLVLDIFGGQLVDKLQLQTLPFVSVVVRSVINKNPTMEPSSSPTDIPSARPTRRPTVSPSVSPTRNPTMKPTSPQPTRYPTQKPTPHPTTAPSESPSTSSSPTGEFDGYFQIGSRPVRIACVGDSLTRGRSGGVAGVHTYPFQLQQMLGESFNVFNYGRNAVTALRGLSVSYVDTAQFQSSLDVEPDIYLLMLGSNDAKYWEAHGQKFRGDMEWIVNKVRSSSMESPIRIIVAIPPWVKNDGAFGIQNDILVNNVQPAIKDLAALQDLELVNMYDLTFNQADSFVKDGLHLSEIGYRSLATAWKTAIQCNNNRICEAGENCITCPRDCYLNCDASLAPTITPNPTESSSPSIVPSSLPTTEAPSAAPTTSTQPTTGDNLRPGTAVGSFGFAIGKCQSDCNSDSDCQFGLICFKRDASEPSVPGCIGDATQIDDGTKAFCIEPPNADILVIRGQEGQPKSAFPLGSCQGNCQQDSDCRAGLKCLQSNDDSVASLPCQGTGVNGLKYCYPPPKGEKFLDFVGNWVMDYYELSTCQGDCDYDSDCAIGLVCYFRDAGDSGNVPGCFGDANGVAYGDDDFCIKRPSNNYLSSVYDNIEGAVSYAYPIRRCSGDCDTDNDCAGSLVCFQRLSPYQPVPGCVGDGEEDYDYCVDPYQGNESDRRVADFRIGARLEVQFFMFWTRDWK